MIGKIIFAAVTLAAFGLFGWQFSRIRKNIMLGTKLNRLDNASKRLSTMLLVAFGQQKMFKRPFPAVLHGLVYVGFIIINIEVLEILIDGLAGTHRVLSFMGPVYDILMAVNEVLGALVIVACIIFLIRRNILKINRFGGEEMSKWPKLDANIILFTEIILMFGLYLFNTGDILAGTAAHGSFPVSEALAGGLAGSDKETWALLSHVGWWVHIVGIYAFLNYLPISKHFHIMLAFPNVYSSKLEPKGMLDNMDSITADVKSMLDPSAPITMPEEGAEIPRLGAKDVTDLPWINLLNAYTCTECGRCTDNCPANITGKKLSPRKIIMDTRDRLEELKAAGMDSRAKAVKYAEEKGTSLLKDYISPEELWACTTCNACTESCPVNIDHVSTIVGLRRFMVMEEASAPQEINGMLTNIQNNGAPWPMAASARFDWAMNIEMPSNKIAK